ncbi:c-type cytochrome [Neisseria canis]|uniref:C-type cytochrome n=1 Tax=Neisseria canis TaxID=493 RepID=A0A1X3CVK1_9NEIS|nr:cytochrome c [Neisseria canis]OSI11653.1 cytochrome C [Neisseria canis]VEF00173.1 C-type cytochrome [Neisseria canis]
MNKSLYTLGALAALSFLTACGGQNNQAASKASTPAEAAASGAAADAKASVKARADLMEAFKEDLGAMGKMVKGEAQFDASAFQQAADNLDANAGKPWEHYTAESAKEESEAKPEIWSKPDEFKKEIDKFTAATAALKTAAASGKLDDVKKPFGAVGQSCKSCHDSFRAE